MNGGKTLSRENTMSKFRCIAAVLAMSIAPSIALAVPADAAAGTITGSVTCINWLQQNSKPVGIWVDSNKADGWATLSSGIGATGAWTTNFRYSATDATSFTLRIGCGGSPQKWATSNQRGPYSSGEQKLTVRY